MKKKKKWKKIVMLIAALALLAGGGYAGVRRYMANKEQSVDVYAVSNINGASWISYYNETTSSGTVVSDVSQNVYVPDDKVISEVFVAEGDEVKIGDKLLAYDTTLLELDREDQNLKLQEIELEIESAEADLKKLKNTTPVAHKPEEDDMLYGPDYSMPDDLGDDEARMLPGDRVLLASQDTKDGGAQESGVQETAAETETTAPETNAGAAENASEPLAETQEQAGTEAASEKEAQTEGQSETGAPADEEQIITENTGLDNGPTDQFNFDDLEDFFAEEKEPEEKDKPKMNQNLRKLLTHIRVKQTIPGEEEELIADTREEAETGISVTADISAFTLNLVPHFAETKDAHFQRLNTYSMRIKGLTLKEDKAGKLYGIAVINGEDYPEIGGYTLIQDPEKDQVAYLTLAFHDGLNEQHEISPELQDVYAEIPITLDEITGEELIFRTKKKENDIKILVEKPEDADAGADQPQNVEDQGESETQPQTPASESETQPQTPASESETEPQTLASESETEPQTAASESETEPQAVSSESETEPQTAASESETEPQTAASENESETEQQVGAATQILFDIIWYHGTNEQSMWPASLSIKMYDEEDKDQTHCLWNTTVPKENEAQEQPELNTESQTEDPAGDAQPETETEKMWGLEELTEAQTELEQPTEEFAPEMDIAVEGEIEQIITPEENTYSSTHMKAYRRWEPLLGDPENYKMVVKAKGSLNYIPLIQWGGTDEQGVRICTVTMKYLEPQESPLVKLEPFGELTYANGVKQQYYKGSGTKDDPYVFFVTDGAVIKSSFVNWVLGFNADGTKRERDGCYVVLEIRESDTITGAFIRSVGLDGTIRMDYGYGPDVYWVFASDSGITRYTEEVDEPGDDFDEPGWFDYSDSYTAEELASAITEKEREIRRLNLDKKEGEMKLRKYDRDLENSTVISSVDGYVKTLGGEAGQAYMVVTSEGGLYLRTSVSELDLGKVKVGDKLKATSWESGSFTAFITEISDYPSDSEMSYGGGQNPNSSNYPVLARIEDTGGLSPNTYAEVKFEKQQSAETGDGTDDGVYLSVMFVRSENGQSYVYKTDENNLLKKQYVRTGGTMEGYVEIKEGLTNKDYIAFPYGKTVKDGAKTKVSEE